MARIDWNTAGSRHFEAGVDRGVLYVGSSAGVPWVGLIGVNISSSGGDAKPRYLDGVKISNHSAPEEFRASIEAYTYPSQFEQCDGTSRIQNGLRVLNQRRKSFHMTYRTKVGNDVEDLGHAYKIHLLYNLRAEPSNRNYRTQGDTDEALTLDWNVTSRAELASGIFPASHFVLDSRDVPAELLKTVEDILYGDATTEPSIPSIGQLIFMFDSFQDLVYDAGSPFTPVFATFDAGSPDTAIDNTIDGGEL